MNKYLIEGCKCNCVHKFADITRVSVGLMPAIKLLILYINNHPINKLIKIKHKNYVFDFDYEILRYRLAFNFYTALFRTKILYKIAIMISKFGYDTKNDWIYKSVIKIICQIDNLYFVDGYGFLATSDIDSHVKWFLKIYKLYPKMFKERIKISNIKEKSILFLEWVAIFIFVVYTYANFMFLRIFLGNITMLIGLMCLTYLFLRDKLIIEILCTGLTCYLFCICKERADIRILLVWCVGIVIDEFVIFIKNYYLRIKFSKFLSYQLNHWHELFAQSYIYQYDRSNNELQGLYKNINRLDRLVFVLNNRINNQISFVMICSMVLLAILGFANFIF